VKLTGTVSRPASVCHGGEPRVFAQVLQPRRATRPGELRASHVSNMRSAETRITSVLRLRNAAGDTGLAGVTATAVNPPSPAPAWLRRQSAHAHVGEGDLTFLQLGPRLGRPAGRASARSSPEPFPVRCATGTFRGETSTASPPLAGEEVRGHRYLRVRPTSSALVQRQRPGLHAAREPVARWDSVDAATCTLDLPGRAPRRSSDARAARLRLQERAQPRTCSWRRG